MTLGSPADGNSRPGIAGISRPPVNDWIGRPRLRVAILERGADRDEDGAHDRRTSFVRPGGVICGGIDGGSTCLHLLLPSRMVASKPKPNA
jgi:hypothetical protein